MLMLGERRILKLKYCVVPLLVLDLGLDIVDGVRGFNLEGDGFAREAKVL